MELEKASSHFSFTTVGAMSDDHDLAWYKAQWNELSELLSVEDPEAVVPKVRRLRDEVESLSAQQEALVEAGVEDPGKVAHMIANLTDQLEELYAERECPDWTERPGTGDDELPASR